MDYIRFRCCTCDSRLKATPDESGDIIACPDCDNPVAIPEPDDGDLMADDRGHPRRRRPRRRRRERWPPHSIAVMLATVAVTFFIPLVGIICGVIDASRGGARGTQGIAMLLMGLTMMMIYCVMLLAGG